MLLDESSDINSDATSTSSEDYEVVAQLIRRRPRTKIPSAPSDSETSDGASDDGDAGVVFLSQAAVGLHGLHNPSHLESCALTVSLISFWTLLSHKDHHSCIYSDSVRKREHMHCTTVLEIMVHKDSTGDSTAH